MIGSFVGYYHLNHGSEFFPETEPDRAIIAINAPDGTDLEETDRIVRQVEEILLAEKMFSYFSVSVVLYTVFLCPSSTVHCISLSQ